MITNFNGFGVGLGFGVGCGFGVGWGFGGMPLNILGLGAGGGCGVGVGLGWGFGSAYGSQYRSSTVAFQGLEFGKEDPRQDAPSVLTLNRSLGGGTVVGKGTQDFQQVSMKTQLQYELLLAFACFAQG
ncbi:hypothetical protein V6N12_065347 [Hibiscus sabdariffa]|uniref:Protein TRIGALACTOSYLDIACYLGLYCEROL 5, chloroplastic n=1 Tax=Hibiscus sabdariffa TaxID=183260 RepID=A0ABR2G8X6_9ROSI